MDELHQMGLVPSTHESHAALQQMREAETSLQGRMEQIQASPSAELSDRMLDLLDVMKLYDTVQHSRSLLITRLLLETRQHAPVR
ncbi:MAG: hypothetical protein HY319_07420 [Armatimonadetes bacterium]|nr:hypothetical protein [Armatimonadota bacterium]